MNYSRFEIRGRTQLHPDDENRYVAYDLATIKPGQSVDVVMRRPEANMRTSMHTLTKLDVGKAPSVLEGWTLENEVGKMTVRLLLLERMKGGGVTALHGRVVLREGRELGVVPHALSPIDIDKNFRDPEASFPTYHNLGSIALIAERLTVGQYSSVLALNDTIRQYA